MTRWKSATAIEITVLLRRTPLMVSAVLVLKNFSNFHTRICRPIQIKQADKSQLIQYAVQRIGHRCDLRNVFDLARYLVSVPPVPSNFRRRMIGLGSGDPTRAICSTLIAQAFQSIRYPILPLVEIQDAQRPDCRKCIKEIMRIRHHSLFTPRKPLLFEKRSHRFLMPCLSGVGLWRTPQRCSYFPEVSPFLHYRHSLCHKHI